MTTITEIALFVNLEGFQPTEIEDAERVALFADLDSDDSEDFTAADDSGDRTDPADSDDFLRPCLAGHDDGIDWDRMADESLAADRLEAAILF